ncbi:uncharacterized protein A1O9_04623 [Exophiala aquamarina CBS 119918]|uniref:L-ornithine N(5)-oxygenase n=1 Tax=Exophiala aquamarina CBS 119918 TaxID=1182545 RepID=A0A072PW59_9EURO|nr:uncharacterized protein A1O9_04623 [Exophiala aquamarina CBS 119918]KEF59775.1 hypothetical protein A1O9_04623 [Exophiala aquamarina CBS 119918]
MHSASWDNDYDLDGKPVAVVGGGSSAAQIIPAIQPKNKKLVPYLRSPIWITTGFGAKYTAPGGVNFQYSKDQKNKFRKNNGNHNQYCRDFEGELNKRFLRVCEPAISAYALTEQADSLSWQRLEKHPRSDRRLSMHLVAQYALGCQRMTPGSDYLPSLRRSNIQVILGSVIGVTEDGVLDAGGWETKVDVIIFPTGFDVI